MRRSKKPLYSITASVRTNKNGRSTGCHFDSLAFKRDECYGQVVGRVLA